MKKKNKIILTTIALFALIALGAISAITYANSPNKDIPLIFSKNDMLQELWYSYKNEYIEKGSYRTLDKSLNGITTSEGQSYTMLRAVWMDDEETFKGAWQWTKDNLQRDDYLMSWKFGVLPNGKYGIQDTVGGQNTATDGDTDIALSLLMAYSRWKDDDYLYDAKPILASIWEREVVSIKGKPVLVANNLERDNPEQVIVNPSYFSPYAYKVFAHVDKDHNWNALADNSYNILNQVSDSKLDKTSSDGLPPDWVVINRKTGEIKAVNDSKLTTAFGFDAIRTPWRLALDYAWYKDERSKEILAKYSLLGKEWKDNGRILAIYNHDGSDGAAYQTPATYGATMGYFKVIDPAAAKEIYQKKLTTLYNPDTQQLVKTLSYYDDNWSWFGMALYLDELPNLTVQ